MSFSPWLCLITNIYKNKSIQSRCFSLPEKPVVGLRTPASNRSDFLHLWDTDIQEVHLPGSQDCTPRVCSALHWNPLLSMFQQEGLWRLNVSHNSRPSVWIFSAALLPHFWTSKLHSFSLKVQQFPGLGGAEKEAFGNQKQTKVYSEG